MSADSLLPGSSDAIEFGCTCDPELNGFGSGYLEVINAFEIDSACPLHGTVSQENLQPQTETDKVGITVCRHFWLIETADDSGSYDGLLTPDPKAYRGRCKFCKQETYFPRLLPLEAWGITQERGISDISNGGDPSIR